MDRSPLPDPNESLIVENARLIECGERQLRLLRRMGDVGIGLVDRLEQIAISRAEAACVEGAAPQLIDDLAGAFAKLTLALRRTLAMEARLAVEMKNRRLGVSDTRNGERAETPSIVDEQVDDTIEFALDKAIRRERPDDDREAVEDLLVDMFERLVTTDELEDYHRRPPGESVAKLCAAFGLDPDFCIQADDETWMIRHGAAEPDDPSLPRSGEGQDAKRPGWGAAGKSQTPDTAAAPHPDGFAVGSSP